MAKFINKKEQVYDLKLTTYGHYLLSIGTFKPTYYAFFDDNVLYDAAYADISESQNNIHQRIKQETSYLEGFVLFKDLEETIRIQNDRGGQFQSISPNNYLQKESMFKLDKMIGDAWLDGETQKAPAWTIVTLQSKISSSQQNDTLFSSSVSQINIDLLYSLKVENPELNLNPTEIANFEDRTPIFADGNIISLKRDDPLIYAEEVNTQLLTKNFDIEVFMTASVSSSIPALPDTIILERKYFEKKNPQIKNGLLLSETQKENMPTSYTTNSVEYYFDIITDLQVNQVKACRGSEIFNKQSYYVDLDFDCEEPEEVSFFDIYGSVVEPEICLD